MDESIREDFPVLNRTAQNERIIYLDSACTSLRPRQVVKAVNEYYEQYPSCGGRSNHRLGERVTREYEKARQEIAEFIQAKPEEIVFTKNTTEALNLVANSISLNKKDVVLTTDKEHNSNLLPWQVLSKKGVNHRVIPSKKDNTFDLEKFEEIINREVQLVSLAHTSNLDGVTIPASEIISIAHDFDALVMLDAAQSVPHGQVNVKELGADFLCFSGHKMLGPSGTGVLYGKHHLLTKMKPFLVGGDTVKTSTYQSHQLLSPPQKFEAGLQNYAGIIGLKAAVEYLERIGMKKIQEHENKLNEIITGELQSQEKISIIGPSNSQLRSSIISFTVEGINHHEVALMLDHSGIMVRSGQHCVHSWFNAHELEGCVRASLYLYNTEQEARSFLQNINKIIGVG